MARPPRSGAPDYDRMMARWEAGQASLRERFEELFDNLGDRIARIERDVATGELERARIISELGEVQLALGEGRDITNALSKRIEESSTTNVVSAAKGAAEGAATVAATVTATVTRKSDFFATWKGWAVAGAAIVAGIGATIDNLPKIVRFFAGFFGFIGGLDK